LDSLAVDISSEQSVNPTDLQLPGKKRQYDDCFAPNISVDESSDFSKRIQQDQDYDFAFPVPDPLVIKDSFHPSSSSSKQPLPSLSVTPPPPKDDIYTDLFSSDPKNAHFEQGDIGDCYLLAVFDAMLRHPKGERILRTFKFEETFPKGRQGKWYRVTFPTGECVEVPEPQVGKKRCKLSPVQGPKGIQLLELAYGKMVRPERNEGLDEQYPNRGCGSTPLLMDAGSPLEALQNIFGGTTLKVIAGKQVPKTDTLSQNANSWKRLEEMMEEVVSDTKHDYLFAAEAPDDLPRNRANHDAIFLHRDWGTPTATKIRFERDHTYSVRSIDPVKHEIIVANPHDTKHEVHKLSWDEFFQVFRGLYGIRIPKPENKQPDSANTLAGHSENPLTRV
jgi:hypothetical protein